MRRPHSFCSNSSAAFKPFEVVAEGLAQPLLFSVHLPVALQLFVYGVSLGDGIVLDASHSFQFALQVLDFGAQADFGGGFDLVLCLLRRCLGLGEQTQQLLTTPLSCFAFVIISVLFLPARIG